MPADTWDTAAWERLGDLLVQRRVELSARFRNLRTFSKDREINYRLAWDAEHAARTNYERPTLGFIELAYGWEAGSIRRVLDGGEPAPIPVDLAEQPAELSPAAAEAFGREIFRLVQGGKEDGEGEGISPEAFRRAVRALAGREEPRRRSNGSNGA